ALHYSRFTDQYILADDSGLAVPALGGAPGVHSARYAGPGATDEDRVRKLLHEMEGKTGDARRAQFICVTAIAFSGRCRIVTSDRARGILLEEPRGTHGFGYDPVFFFPELGKTYAELTREKKNRVSHRGKSFRKAISLLLSPYSVTPFQALAHPNTRD
ncbi:MAG: non-canonical purine NTP pyrophosphatase, partial [Candidatus Binataceae bacterium]